MLRSFLNLLPVLTLLRTYLFCFLVTKVIDLSSLDFFLSTPKRSSQKSSSTNSPSNLLVPPLRALRQFSKKKRNMNVLTWVREAASILHTFGLSSQYLEVIQMTEMNFEEENILLTF